MNFFIDSHAHLNDPAFDADRDSLLQHTLPQAGIVHSIEIGCSPEEWLPALQLASSYPALVHAVLGVHPEYAVKLGENDLARLAQLLPDPRNTAVGEIGLDYTCLDISPKDLQQKTFQQMLELGNQTQLPLVLHKIGRAHV